ncbi:MAG: peptidoglycan DD-metalloendopeptidase family protein [Candidatus Limnocylindrales bacterium]|nr:peptidoglycan DD-metalloendopeptidase family protein [Candidatus Limnocylindrales bacterium]
MIGAPGAAPSVQGDELSEARARQARLKKDVAAQKAQVARLQRLQTGLSSDIRDTAGELRGINADIRTVKSNITAINEQIATVQGEYDALVAQLADLDDQLIDLEARETAKKAELAERKALLAERVRSAYDSDRTSLLESFLSGGTFTDLLAEMSYFIDVGEQDKALAMRIASDQETLAEIHQTVADTRTQTNELRQDTAAQKRDLDRSLTDLQKAKDALKALEKRTATELAKQEAAYANLARNKSAARTALAKAEAAQKRLQNRIAELIRRRAAQGRIPSVYNGSLAWPMGGTVTQSFGCTGFGWEPRVGRCAHFHRGIDVVAPTGTPIRASGAGTVVYIGWNFADGADPAWIVVIAHSSSLQTWYAHMLARRPNGIRSGSQVRAGQIIGYEGNTGHSTGAHLHWAVMYRGSFINPRLFL